MLNPDNKISLCQISLTGVRAIVLLGMLIQVPRSLEEIKEQFVRYNIMEDSNSDDIIRIDINTLKKMGCEISRADHRTNNKFVLINHPFKFNVTQDEIDILKKAFNKIKENASIDTLIGYNELFKKIANFVSDSEIKEQLLGLSPLKSYSYENVKELMEAAKKNQTVKLSYKAPTFKEPREKEILADEVVFQNNKLYLYGIDKESKESIYLNIKRILKIISIGEKESDIVQRSFSVKFYLKDFGASGLEDEETIISGDVSEGFIIEGKYHNEFYATQRILSFGSKCTIIEPKEFKVKIIELLRKMRDVYNG